MGHRVEAEFTRMIDGKPYKVQRIPTGYGGRAISKSAFGGRKGARKGGSIGNKESVVERGASLK